MARKSKKKTTSEDLPEVEIDANPPEDYIEDAVEVTDDTESTFEQLEDAEPVEDVSISETVEDALEEPAESSYQEPAAAPEPRRGGFLPLLLGGLVAGGIGYGISYFQWANSSDVEALIAEQAKAIAALKDDVANLPAPTDIAPLSSQVEGLGATLEGVGAGVDELGTQMTTAVERIEELERRPNADGTLADTALAAFEADIQVLRDEIVEQQSEMAAMAVSASDQLQATREEAIAIEENAVATARKATARTVLAQIQTTVDSGGPLGALLSDLGGALDEPVPEALENIADGAPTLLSLQDAYPDAARAALRVARTEGVSGEESSGLSSFLRNQFDVRSTALQEGDSTDAVLSRVEASLRSGQLNDALAEVAALPEVVRGAMSDWTGRAELRASALDAISQLSDTLNIN